MSRFAEFSRNVGEVPHFAYIPETPRPATTQTKVSRLFVDNRDRHNASSVSPFDFRVYFGNDPGRSVGISGYENVVSVELKAVAMPKVANEPYIILSIDELNDSMLDSTSRTAHNAFAVLYFDSDFMATGSVKPLKGTDFYQKILAYNPPIAKLKSMHVRFLKYDGNVVTTSDTNGNANVSLMFEVTSRVNRRN